jgi:hypothetical protein
MVQLSAMLIVPPIAGVIAYMVVRRLWERDEIDDSKIVSQHNPSAVTPGRTTSADD